MIMWYLKISYLKLKSVYYRALALDVKDDLDAEFEDFSVEKTEKSYLKNYNLIKEFVKDDSSEVLKEKLNGLNTDEKWFLQTKGRFK